MTEGNKAQVVGNAVAHVPGDVVKSAAEELANVIDSIKDVVTTAANAGDVTADTLLDQLSGHVGKAEDIVTNLLHLSTEQKTA